MNPVRVTSLNVGLPREVDWSGRTVLTGAWKSAVSDRRHVSHLNIEGDGQGDLAGHGGVNRAVLVYQEESYEFWRGLLGRPELTAGRFGDNITIDGFPDSEVCIGDRYRIGTAEFEVSQPRVTCYRVGLRNDEPRLASLMVQHGRPGFYMRVLVEGNLAAGDEVSLVSRDPVGLTVAEVDALLYLPNPSQERLAVARDHATLSDGWRGSFREMLEDSASASPVVAAPGWPGFRQLRVDRVVKETEAVSSFYFAEPAGRPLPPALPGQYLTLKLANGPSTLIRNYSLSALANGAAGYRISVKREPGGVFSNLLHDTLKAGDVVDVAAPRGEFVLKDDVAPVVLVSAGVGITPILPMLQALAAQGGTRETWWLHGARTFDDYPLVAEVVALAGEMTDIHVHTWVSRGDVPASDPDDSVASLGKWHAGRITTAALEALDLPTNARAYVCGPAPFIDAATKSLIDVGLSQSAVTSELFNALAASTPGVVGQQVRPPHQPEHIGHGPMVSFTRSQLEVPWSEEYRTLLEFAEACDVPTRWSCRTGVCHTCITPLISGSVTYIEEPLVEPETGEVLICSTKPNSMLVLDL